MLRFRLLRYAWALPASLLGLWPVPIVYLQGGRARVVDGVLEVQGGIITRLLRRLSASAMTWGHVVWGCDHACLDRSRRHERVHVRQYEQWGPFFLPAYLLSSLWEYSRGRNPYLDNCFERQAYDEAP